MPRQPRTEQQESEQQAGGQEPEALVGTIREEQRPAERFVADRGRAQQWAGGGASGDPRELDRVAGFAGAMYGDGTQPRQVLPPLARQSAQQAFQSERRAALDAIPPAKKYRVVSVPRAQGPSGESVMALMTVGGRQVRVLEGKEMDERYFDIPALKRQGVRFKEILPEEEAAAAAG
jgi:hypothetical protein